MRPLRVSLPVLLAGTALLILASIQFLDRPAARFAHNVIGQHRALMALTLPPEYLARLSLVLLVALGLTALRRPLGNLGRTVLLASLSLTIAAPLNDWLKTLFGRTWPETWVGANPSFIKDHVYGFTFLHGGIGWASFPSGHMVAVSSFFGVFLLISPARWHGLWLRPLWIACIALVAIGLYGMDYHFVSDILAGTTLGLSVAATVVRLAPRRVSAGR